MRRTINQQKPWSPPPILARHACRGKCPHGTKCCLDDNGHTLHICNQPSCPCHSRARYDRRGGVSAHGAQAKIKHTKTEG